MVRILASSKIPFKEEQILEVFSLFTSQIPALTKILKETEKGFENYSPLKEKIIPTCELVLIEANGQFFRVGKKSE